MGMIRMDIWTVEIILEELDFIKFQSLFLLNVGIDFSKILGKIFVFYVYLVVSEGL